MHCLSQTLEEPVDMAGAADMVYGNILFVTRLAPVTLNSREEKSPREAWPRHTYRMAIFPGLARGDIFSACPPSNLDSARTAQDHRNGRIPVSGDNISSAADEREYSQCGAAPAWL